MLKPAICVFLVCCLGGFLTAQLDIRHTLIGPSAADEFGAAVGVVGDIDGDGCSDVAIGAPFDDVGGLSSGRAQVFSGRTGAVLLDIHGPFPQALAGFGVFGAGDVNGDEVPDVLVGLSANGSTGMGPGGGVQVHSGVDGAILHVAGGTTLNDGFGIALHSAGDVNLDGFDDYIVGAPGGAGSFSGYARVHSGFDGQVLHSFSGTVPQERFGFAVSGGADVDGDQVPDLIVGAIGHNSAGTLTGRVYVYSGANGALIHGINGLAAQDQFGHGVDLIGDLNGDGLAEILVGAYRPAGIGYTRVYSGADVSVLHHFSGVSQEAFGHWVASAGDTDGDGFADIVVGAPEADVGGFINSGRVLIYSGATGGVLREFRGGGSSRRLGYSVSPAGDTNNDGFDDVLLGSDVTGGAPGRALIVSLCGTEIYGVEASSTQTLLLQFNRGLSNQIHQGSLAVEGASSFASGALAASFGQGATTVLGTTVLVNTLEVFVAQFGFQASGRFDTFLNLKQPALAGLSLYLQAFAFDPSAPQGLFGSNGLGLLFTN